jgi:putative ABC transport system ATP-binding protein
MKLLLSLNKNDGTTLLIVTHDPEVATIAERVIHLRDGLIENEEVRR